MTKGKKSTAPVTLRALVCAALVWMGCAMPAAALDTAAFGAAKGFTLGYAAQAFHQPINQRAPRRTDDSAHGYAVGDYWNFSGQIYTALDVTAGAAVWQPLYQSQALWLDQVGSATAAYGTVKLRAAYAGASLHVIRASDSTGSDVGFVNNQLDVATLDAFCAGTTCAVDKFYDQSGNTNDATQTTAANRPVIGVKKVGNVRALTCLGDTGSSVLQYLAIPGTVSTNRQGNSIYVVSTQMTSQINAGIVELGGSGTTETVYLDAGTATGSEVLKIHTGTPITTFQPASRAAVWSIVSGASNVLVAQNNTRQTISVGSATALTGGMICNTSRAANYNGRMDVAAVVIYAAGHTASQIQTITSLALSQFGITPQSDVNLVYSRDSITFGRGSALGQPREYQLRDFLGEDVKLYNLGIPGEGLVGGGAYYSVRAGPLYQSGKTNILILFEGTNDIHLFGYTGAQVYAAYQTYVSAAHATGYKVCVATMLPRSDFTAGQQTEQGNFNTLLRGDKAGADCLLDYQADPTMGYQGNTGNTALFTDGVHPSTLGYSYLTGIDAKALAPLLPAYTPY